MKSGKQAVELRPSRIRREPPPAEKDLLWRSREWDKKLALAGIVLFALALWALSIGISEITSH